VNDVRRETAGLQRKILGSWKQYSGREFLGFFPMDSDNFQCFPRRSFRKSSENSGREYCFHVPDISRVVLQDPETFLQDPVAGMIDLGRNFLNHVIIPHIHKEKLELLDLNRMCSEFISKNQNRKTFFGHE
jgi:hypothetical protein